MVAFLAALPAIFAAIKGATEVFDLGKKVVEDITGNTSSAQTPDELNQEIENLPAQHKSAFVERMKQELAAYDAISHRLSQQGGQVDAQTMSAIPEQDRAQIAMLRMTTRPWAVRWMVVAVVFPPLATVSMNMFISFYNVMNKAWALNPKAIDQIVIGTVLNDLYLSMVGWASGVIMTYMGMREIGKAVGHKDSVTVSDITGSLTNLMGSMKRVFN